MTVAPLFSRFETNRLGHSQRELWIDRIRVASRHRFLENLSHRIAIAIRVSRQTNL